MATIASVETFIVTIPRDTPYLGPLAPGERVNSRGYIVRSGNGTIYPNVDRSVVLRITTDAGTVGWGETYGICAPKATCEIINDLLAPVLIGASPARVEELWDELYGLMRVRGCTGGFYVDAIAALDIAMWDLVGRERNESLASLVGPPVHESVPGYLSGLPAATLQERIAFARSMHAAGHRAFKFAAVISREGIVEEMRSLREALGDEAELMVDLHWKFDARSALSLARELAPYRPTFIEAPVKPEDVAGLAQVAAQADVPIAAGEEWHTSYEVRNRVAAAPIAFIQPEMAHTGITQFRRIAALAADAGISIAPHATVGIGIFLAASLQISAVLPHLWKHEWQHSVFDRNRSLLSGDMRYEDGRYSVPIGPGLGVEPAAGFWELAELVS